MKNPLSIIVMILLVGCKTFEPTEPPVDQNPVFSAKGLFNGQEQTFDADGKNYNAFAESADDSLNVKVHKAGLNSQACNDCDPTLEVELRAMSASNMDVVSVLQQSQISIRFIQKLDSVISYMVKLSPEFIGNMTQISWTVLEDQQSVSNPVFEIQPKNGNTKIPVEISAKFTAGCEVNLVDTIYLPTHRCDAKVYASVIDSLLVEYKATASGGSAYSYNWVFSSGVTAKSNNVRFNYPSPIIDKEIVFLNVSNEHNSVTKRFVKALTSNADCDLNMNYSIDEKTIYKSNAVKPDFGTMVLRYSANGKVYSSEFIQQPNDAQFTILSTEEYTDLATPGRTFLKTTMHFSGLLSNGQETISVKDLELVLPFEI